VAGPIRIAVLADAAQAKRELDGVARTGSKLEGKMSKLRAPAAAVLGGIALGARQAVKDASDLNEETSKTGVIFGKQAGGIKRFAAGAATALGQSKVEALAASSTFGLIGQKAGLGGKETASFAKKFTGLSSDLASFNNTTPEQAIEAIGAAMRGESEPIRKYGVLLDDATLRARALRMGLVKNTKEALTPQTKALAAAREIWAQTGKAQGDFARTSDGAANQGRIAAAQARNLSATVAIAQGAVAAATGASTATIAANSVAMKAHAVTTRIISGVTKVWAGVQWLLNAAMLANPIGLVVIAVVAFVAAIVIAWKKSETFRKVVIAAWNAIKGAAGKVWDWIKAKLAAVWQWITTTIPNKAKALVAKIAAGWEAAKAKTAAGWDRIKSAVSNGISRVVGFVKSLPGKLIAIHVAAYLRLREIVSNGWDRIKTAVTNGIQRVIGFVKDLPGKIKSALGNLGSLLLNAGKDIIQGLLNGITSKIGAVKDKLGQLTSMIPKIKGPPSRDRKLLRGAGQLVIDGFVRGLEDKRRAVRAELTSLSREVGSFAAPALGATADRSSYTVAAGAGGAGGGTLRIDVRVDAGIVNDVEVGRQVANALKAYYGAGGAKVRL
jgi:F0F1-type ATP synthase assembly protein I